MISHRSTLRSRFYLAVAVTTMLLGAGGCSDEPTKPGAPPDGKEPSGWFWQNPLPQGNRLNSVCFTDANTGTAVGSAGTILRTTTGGVAE